MGTSSQEAKGKGHCSKERLQQSFTVQDKEP